MAAHTMTFSGGRMMMQMQIPTRHWKSSGSSGLIGPGKRRQESHTWRRGRRLASQPVVHVAGAGCFLFSALFLLCFALFGGFQELLLLLCFCITMIITSVYHG
ncbi:hypothetical protein BZA05DRAFT_397941 [Tricharina praecox]|uniref:uncharacterized protein n=1 Tax=Tricharina praecox TaxID=43433 RepID=UPI002220582E|nr:uncharacterized protein BZA05DRAFT_397941 [Tricharina praecox]KAI5851824.1 hypothetical protein BZA05DRAFT_397941 [Tricharina praecox]